jgi:hypothetical protein
VNRAGGLVVDTFWDLPHTRDLIAHYARVWREPARRGRQHASQRRPLPGAISSSDAESSDIAKCAESFGGSARSVMQMLRSQTGSDIPRCGPRREARDWDFTGVELTPPTTLVDERLDLDLDGIPSS